MTVEGTHCGNVKVKMPAERATAWDEQIARTLFTEVGLGLKIQVSVPLLQTVARCGLLMHSIASRTCRCSPWGPIQESQSPLPP